MLGVASEKRRFRVYGHGPRLGAWHHGAPPARGTINRRRWFEARRVWRLSQYHPAILGRRQGAFVDALFRRARTYCLTTKRKRVPYTLFLEFAVASIADGGYRMAKRVSKFALENKAKDLLALPKVQQALDDKFNAAGLTLDRCAEIVSNAAEGKIEKPDMAAVQLRAIDMRIRMTTGYAPTKSANLNISGNADQFFDQEEFKSPPPINVTP